MWVIGTYILEPGPPASQDVCLQEARTRTRSWILNSSTQVHDAGVRSGGLTPAPHIGITADAGLSVPVCEGRIRLIFLDLDLLCFPFLHESLGAVLGLAY